MRAKKRTSAASVREGAGRSVGGVGTYSGETTYGLPVYGWYLETINCDERSETMVSGNN